MITCSKEKARNFLLSKQLLLNPREMRGYSGIERVFNTLGSIQFDPQNICGRNPDLVLQARVKDIKISDYYKWLYDDNKGIEIFDKELCIVPISGVNLTRKYFTEKRRNKLNNFFTENKEKIDDLKRIINTKGAICSFDYFDKRKVDIAWAPVRWTKYALDNLWKDNQLVIEYRKNNRKYYNLPQNVYGKSFKFERDTKLSTIHILRRIDAVGMLPITGTGSGWLGIGNGNEIRELINKLIIDKQLSVVQVEDKKNLYVIKTDDVELLEILNVDMSKKKVTFIAPLDNLLWDRKMIQYIFDFEYKWEAYTPQNLRLFGHYVLPILYGDKLIGRIEPKINRGNKTLEITGIWFEKGFKKDKKFIEGFYEYIYHFMSFSKTEKINWICRKLEN